MATIQFKKGDDYLDRLSKLEASVTRDVCGYAIYVGAEVVTDAIRAKLRQLPTATGHGSPSKLLRGHTKAQVKGLEDSLGIAPMQDDGTGYYNVKIGFDGYNHVRSKRWPKGQPNQMVARSMERGTSFMEAHHFVKEAMAKVRKLALELMGQAVDEKIKKIMKG